MGSWINKQTHEIVNCARKLGCLGVRDVDTMYKVLILEKKIKDYEKQVQFTEHLFHYVTFTEEA